MNDDARAAVVTGCGVLSPFGHGVEPFWQGLVDGRCAIQEIKTFDATGLAPARAGEVAGFDELRASSGLGAELERIEAYALVATAEALDAARLDPAACDRDRVGVILASNLGGMMAGEEYQEARAAGRRFDASRLLRVPYYAVASLVARRLGARGPVATPAIACASGTHAVGMATELIALGHADAFVVGGVETLCRYVVAGFNCLRATSASEVRPFDARRDGLLLGEGAAILVVESAEHAAGRGAAVLARVAGTGLAGDATHMTAPDREGGGAARAMRQALATARVAADEVDFVSTHGTGTVYNDAMEIAAIRSVLGTRAAAVPCNSIKGAIGHTLGAAGAFEAVMSVRAIAEDLIPPTAGCEQPVADCGLDVVRGGARRASVGTVLSTSSAFAGNNAALVLRAA